MNVIGIARHGIGIAGVPPIGIAIARGIVIDCVRHADPAALVVQVAVAEAETGWIGRLARVVRPAPVPPGVAFAVRIANGSRTIGTVLVAEHETDLGDRPGAVIRIGFETIDLDRRDGTPATPVEPALIGLAEAEAWARDWSRE